MSGPRITDAAVEAVREAFRNATDSDEAAISDESDLFRFILTAALPHIRRAVIEELAEKAETQSTEAYSGYDMIPQHLKGFPEGQHQRSLGLQANHAHWWLRAELESPLHG